MSAVEPYPRVLIVSHNPLSDTQNNGKTLSVFFEGWPKESLAQLYFTLDEPSFTLCDRFYRITDLDMLKRAAGRPNTAGVVVQEDTGPDRQLKSELHRNPLYNLVRKIFLARFPAAMIARSLFWRKKWWKTSDLGSWLDDFCPDVVFFQSSGATFAFDVVEEICAHHRIPLVMETTDDYVTPDGSLSPFSWIHYRRMQRVYQRAVNRSHCVIAIGEKMAKEYRQRFGGNFDMAMNSVSPGSLTDSEPASDPMVLMYAGNVGLNRWKVLHSIGEALEECARTHGVDARLDVYSIDVPEPKILEALNIPGRLQFCGKLVGDELDQRRSEATMLVHVESFDKKNRHVTRLSISTKIPEYFAVGRPILAVGPADVASIEYVREHQAGCVISSAQVSVLAEELAAVLQSRQRQEEYRENGLGLVERFHLKEVIQQKVQAIVVESIARS